MNKALAVFIFILVPLVANSQASQWKWASGIPCTQSSSASAVAVDNSGNVVSVGDFSGSVTIGSNTLTSVGMTDLLVTKYSPAGNLMWSRQANGYFSRIIFGVVTDSSGNIYVSGDFSDTATFGNTKLIAADTLHGSQYLGTDIFVAKYDKNGNFIWAKQFGGKYVDRALRITADRHNHLYIAGEFASEGASPPLYASATFGNITITCHGAGDAYVAKLDTAGNVIWVKGMGGKLGNTAFGLASDADDNIFISGNVASPAHFDSLQLNFSTGGGTFLAKYDSSGHALWVRGATGNLNVLYGGAVAVDSKGNSYTTSLIYGNPAYFGSTTVVGDDAIIAKYNSSGVLQWAKPAGDNNDDEATNIITDASCNIYVTGYFKWTGRFGRDTIMGNGSYDVFVAKYDSSGNCLWATKAGGTGDDRGHDITTDNLGSLYVTGVISGPTVTFGTHSVSGLGNGLNMFTAKLSTSGTGITTMMGTTRDIYTYPNPSNGSFTFQYGDAAFSELSISNAVGSDVYRHSLQAGKQSEHIGLPYLADGVYFLTASGARGRTTRKIVIRN